MNTNYLPGMMVHTTKKASNLLISAIQSMLMLFCLLFPLQFMSLILHEGGHALVHLVEGKPITNFYVHPFLLNGYVRPIVDWNNVWNHISGTALAVPVSLIIFLFVWKHRSLSNLPIVMLFPFVAFLHGIGFTDFIFKTGDYYNITVVSKLPPVVLYIFLSVFLLAGIFFMVSLFPLLGLAPQDWRTIIVIPVSMLLWGLLSSLVAHVFIPGSSIDVQYQMADELINSANPTYGVIFGTFLALIYFTLYRIIYRRLPAGLRTEKVTLSWRDLRIPALLSAISVVLGIIVIQ
ncbi:MAG: hypothetical protein A2Y88_05205 [Chloroflexi bacterium RBG_13_48_10]|nr:MAG: hypothetical protein A2Y88_05205 [Chloroflexi bacterium RBG_13_48_10]